MTTWTNSLDAHIAPDLGRSALIVIDTQVDFIDGGAWPIPGTTQILPNIARLLAAYRAAAAPIVHVVRLYDGDDVDLLRRVTIAAGAPIARPGSAGSQIAPDLRLSVHLISTRQLSSQAICSTSARMRSLSGNRAGAPSIELTWTSTLPPSACTPSSSPDATIRTARERASTTPANATTGCSSLRTRFLVSRSIIWRRPDASAPSMPPAT